jgi:uncharacterized protein (TIRG00374 family)
MKKTTAKLIRSVVYLLTAAVLIGFIASFVGLERLSAVIGKLSYVIIPLIVIYFIDWVLRALRWRLLMKQNGYDLGVFTGVRLSLLGNFANLIIPAKLGDAIWVYATKKHNKDFRVSTILTTVVIDRFYDFVAVTLLTIGALFFVIKMSMDDWVYEALLFAVVIIVLFVIGLVMLVKYKEFSKKFLVGPLKVLKPIVDNTSDAVRMCFKDKRVVLLCVMLSLVVWILEAGIFYVIIMAQKVNVAASVVLLAAVLGNMSKALPLTPASIGVYESVMAAVLTVGGIGFKLGMSFALIDNLFKSLFVAVVGGVAASKTGINVISFSKKDKE